MEPGGQPFRSSAPELDRAGKKHGPDKAEGWGAASVMCGDGFSGLTSRARAEMGGWAQRKGCLNFSSGFFQVMARSRQWPWQEVFEVEWS